ncbi:TetR/AcrR family transcriptional regulator [Belnapia sp. T18]|uniref:TetR/AcrR family transcriptional regulator n=1 Tax=Belnapia arida TaxID=2804533 RepID=A0ABS1U0R1_9PROT|nr:TetR/AcrR family transcriptional regulator [Belnapia arida]MBL6078267.1 TetR/AcrR family transcriptional regulator [Belnapia arida]
MTEERSQTPRKPRADATRNRDRLLAAARTVFNQGGPAASLEAVAREAGLGIGTLYRHFPTREALYEAVYRREVDQLVELAARLSAELPPAEALRRWLAANVEFIATKKGMAAALAMVSHKSSESIASALDRLRAALGGLLRRATEAGDLRSDLDAEELLLALVGVCYAQEGPDWRSRVLRVLDVLIAGLRR